MAKIYRTISTTSSGGGGGGSSSPYTQLFNSTSDWGSASGGYYSISITQSTHEKGTSPSIQIFELVGSDYEQVDVDTVLVSSTGDITIKVTQTLDTRFAGKIVIL